MTKLNSTGSALVFSTYLGGNGDDGAMAIALDGSNNIWVTGASESNNFPTTADAYHVPTGQAAFLANLNSTVTKLLFSSFVSNGGEFDQGMGVALDTNGNVYAVGQEGDLPIFPIAPGFNCLGWSPGSCECNRDVSTVNGVQRTSRAGCVTISVEQPIHRQSRKKCPVAGLSCCFPAPTAPTA